MVAKNKNFIIDVTAEDMAAGVRGNSRGCAVVKALARQIPGSYNFDVDSQSIQFNLNGFKHRYFTPAPAQAYIAAFDEGVDTPPFTITLMPKHGTVTRKATMGPVGKASHAANKRAHADYMKKVKAEGREPTDEDRLAARLVAREASDAARIAAGADITRRREEAVDGRPPLPNVVKSVKRTYGHRRLLLIDR